MPPMCLPPLLTDADLARTFRTTPAAVRKLRLSAGLPHVELPRIGIRFLAEDIGGWIRGLRRAPPADGGPEAPREDVI